MRASELLIVLSLAAPVTSPADRIFVVRGPTIVAFFPPANQKQVEGGSDFGEALSDFHFYASRVREPLTKAGVDFHVVSAAAFRVRVGRVHEVFRPTDPKIGYYLVAPGKQARIQYGVATDSDLLQSAREYFGLAIENGAR